MRAHTEPERIIDSDLCSLVRIFSSKYRNRYIHIVWVYTHIPSYYIQRYNKIRLHHYRKPISSQLRCDNNILYYMDVWYKVYIVLCGEMVSDGLEFKYAYKLLKIEVFGGGYAYIYV